MVTKTKPATQMIRKPLTQHEIEALNVQIAERSTQLQWFSVVHQEMFALNITSYEQASKLVSTLDFGRTCHVRLVNDVYQILHSFH